MIYNKHIRLLLYFLGIHWRHYFGPQGPRPPPRYVLKKQKLSYFILINLFYFIVLNVVCVWVVSELTVVRFIDAFYAIFIVVIVATVIIMQSLSHTLSHPLSHTRLYTHSPTHTHTLSLTHSLPLSLSPTDCLCGLQIMSGQSIP